MSEARLVRLEDKVDGLKDDVAEVKTSVVKLEVKMERHIDLVEGHIGGDNKIITKIMPILDELPTIIEIVKKHEFEKEVRRLKEKTIRNWTKNLTLASVTVSLFWAIAKFFNL